MSDIEIKLECLKMYVATASRFDLSKELCIDYARKAFDFVMETPVEVPLKQPEKASKNTKANSK